MFEILFGSPKVLHFLVKLHCVHLLLMLLWPEFPSIWSFPLFSLSLQSYCVRFVLYASYVVLISLYFLGVAVV